MWTAKKLEVDPRAADEDGGGLGYVRNDLGELDPFVHAVESLLCAS